MTFNISIGQLTAGIALVGAFGAGAGYVIDTAMEYRDIKQAAAEVPTVVESLNELADTVSDLTSALEQLDELSATVQQLDGFRTFMELLMQARGTQFGPLDPGQFYDVEHTHNDGTTHAHP